MAIPIVFRSPVYRIFRASSTSIEYWLVTFISILRFLLPLIIIFMTKGVWKKTGTYREMPLVDFASDYVIVAEGQNDYILSSTLPVLNSAQADHFTQAQVVTNRNGNWMNILVTIERNNITVHSLTYILLFNYQLDYHSIVEAQLILTDSIRIESSSTSQITVIGTLAVDQNRPLPATLSISTIARNSMLVEDYLPQAIIQRSHELDLALQLKRKHMSLHANAYSGDTISLDLRIYIAEDEFTYKTDFWELIKWAWIQYFCIFVIVYLVTERFLESLLAGIEPTLEKFS